MTIQVGNAKVRVSGAWVPAVGGSSAPWTRPSGWLALPTIGAGVQKFAGLFQVTNDDGNYLALQVAGDYTVDWGDGNVENVASGVNAEHLYAYADVGSEITVNGITYRQALVVVTPQDGHDLTALNLQQAHSALNITPGTLTNTAWLDCFVSSPVLGTLSISGGATPNADGVTLFGRIQHFRLGENVLTSAAYLFASAGTYEQFGALQSVTLGDLSALTDATYMFYACSALQSVTLGDLSALTDATYMFYACYALQSVTLGDLSALTDATYMFAYCYALQSVTLGDLSALTDATYMFAYCSALQGVTLGDLSALTDATSMFAYCYALQSVTLPSIGVDFSIANCKIGRAALVALFGDLATVAKTITITGNYGSAALSAGDLLIATAKGWTVTQ